MGRFGDHVIDADGHGGDLPNWQARIPAAFQPQWEERRERIKKQFANLPGRRHQGDEGDGEARTASSAPA